MSAAANLSPSPEVAEAPVPIVAAPAAEFRSRMGNIGRQSAVFFAGTILTVGAGYFFRVYLARTLGAEKLGLYTMGMTVVGFLSLFTALGLPTAASRFVAEYSAKRDYARLGSFFRWSFAALVPANLLLGVVILVVGPWISVHFYHSPALSRYFWLFALIMFAGAFTTFLGQTMAGYQDVSRRTLITHFIGTPTNMIIAVILISVGFGLGGYLAAQVFSAFLVLALLGINVWKMTPAKAWRANHAATMPREVAAFSAAAFVLSVVQFSLAQADNIVLGHYLNARQVGIYAVAMALVGFVPVILSSVNQIFSPIIAELHASGSHALLQQLFSTLTKWVLALTLPLALTIIFFSRPLLAIFGSAFEAGAVALIIGTLGQLINCGVGSVGYLLLMSGHEGEMVRIQAVNAVLMIVLATVLVPRIGMKGAALAEVVAVSVTNVWELAVVSRRLKLFPYERSFLKLVLPCALAVATLALVRSYGRTHSPWVLAAGALTGAYIVFLGSFALIGMDSKDRALIQAAWSKVASNSRKIGVNFG